MPRIPKTVGVRDAADAAVNSNVAPPATTGKLTKNKSFESKKIFWNILTSWAIIFTL